MDSSEYGNIENEFEGGNCLINNSNSTASLIIAKSASGKNILLQPFNVSTEIKVNIFLMNWIGGNCCSREKKKTLRKTFFVFFLINLPGEVFSIESHKRTYWVNL